MPIININKASGMTSHDVVSCVRKITKIKRVGHAGTLDPLASGVLVVGIGREATKQLGVIAREDKEYEAVIKLGATSTTDDAQGQISSYQVVKIPTLQAIQKITFRYLGEIDQKPPQFSAIKVGGKRAHLLARQGIKMNLGTRKVLIRQIQIIKYQWPELRIKVNCGSGTYIRALARDMGKTLEVGGYIQELVRTRLGGYQLNEAMTLEEFRMKKTNQSHNDAIDIARGSGNGTIGH